MLAEVSCNIMWLSRWWAKLDYAATLFNGLFEEAQIYFRFHTPILSTPACPSEVLMGSLR